MKKAVISILLLACAAGGIVIYMNSVGILNKPYICAASSIFEDSSEKNIYRRKEDILYSFIEKNLIDPDGGIITNISPANNDNGTLAESVGLLLKYAVISEKEYLFKKEYKFLKQSLLTVDGQVRWRSGNDITCNASIDDLRIVRALMDGYDKWGEKEYLDTAYIIHENMYSSQVRNYSLCEIYDWKYNICKNSTPLCYLDLYTLHKMRQSDDKWDKVLYNSFEIIEGGKIKDSPLYYKYFDFTSNKYSLDEEYTKKGAVCLTYSLYTAIHLEELNIETERFKSWLKSEFKKGKICAWYNPLTLKPTSGLESTAVYALAAVYARLAGDQLLSQALTDRMLEFMVADEASKYYGGFGNKDTGEFYSFDNLTALWALSVNR